MNRYIARVDLDYSFAEYKLSSLGSFWKAVAAGIPAENEPKLETDRFSFGTFSLCAETVESCRELIMAAWKQTFPDNNAVTEILVSELPDDERGNLFKVIYNNYYGANDYLRLITDLNSSIPLLKEAGAVDVIRRQNYLFAVDGGCGFSCLLSSLGDYLRRSGIFPDDQFEKRTWFIEMIVADDKNGSTTPDDLIEWLGEKKDEHTYNIVGLDIAYFLNGRKFDELRTLLHRLEKFQDDYVFAFRIPFIEKKALDDLCALMDDILLLRPVVIPPLADCVLMENIWNLLTSRSFTPDPSVFDLVRAKINREKSDGRFYGFKTAEKLSFELILKKTSDTAKKLGQAAEPDKKVIKGEDVAGFGDAANGKLSGFEQLSELIGMEELTKRIREIVAQVKVSIREEGLDRPGIHMRFTGSPGTGKTTVARILGQILREEGVLRKGGFFEYGARDLVAEYEGQTAVKTASICRDAYGSVLFIDEAYALNEGNNNNANFGREALATLVSEMENHRDDMLVVMAGYTDEMDALMKVNPGLRSRMPYLLHFDNYTREQLFEIFMLMVRKHFRYDALLEQQAKDYFLSLSDEYLGSKEFANARFVRNLYERTWSKGALRCSLAGMANIVLTREDFISASSEKEFSEKLSVKNKLGFGQ